MTAQNGPVFGNVLTLMVDTQGDAVNNALEAL
jgi:hypothetical protein